MKSDVIPPDSRFLALLLKAYLLGTIISALVLYIAAAIITPGDGGTWVALTSGLYIPILIILGIIAVVIFPLAAVASWPLRGLVFRKPLIAFLSAAGCGLLVGAITTSLGFKAGLQASWSGALVGLTYGLVWFLTVRLSSRQTAAIND
jgi:hypothetical protein